MVLCKYLYSIFVLIHRNLIMMIDVNQSPVLFRHTNKTNQHLNILANLRANSLLCRPTLILYVPRSRLTKKRHDKLGLTFVQEEFNICRRE